MLRRVSRWIGAAVAITVAIAGCDSESDLPPPFRSGIDQLEAQKDCAELQDRFDGVSDAAYLEYIDDAMRDAGCYD